MTWFDGVVRVWHSTIVNALWHNGSLQLTGGGNEIGGYPESMWTFFGISRSDRPAVELIGVIRHYSLRAGVRRVCNGLRIQGP
jgi:hypothetical protein